MLTIDQLKSVKTIITHDHCPDGTASAILLHDVLPDAEVKFVQYNTEAHRTLVPTPGMLICDFSPFLPKKEVEIEGEKKQVPDYEKVQPFVDAGVIVLDHHKGAKKLVEMFGANGVFADEETEPGVSGAVLAFRHVWLPLRNDELRTAVRDHVTTKLIEGIGGEVLSFGAKTVEELAEQMGKDLRGEKDGHDVAVDAHNYEFSAAFEFATIAGIRDTWQNMHPSWRQASIQTEMVMFYPQADWLALKRPFHVDNGGWWKERFKLGEILLKKHEAGVQRTLEKAWRFTSASGTRVVAFSGTRNSSDAAEVLNDTADLIVGFDYLVELDGGQSVPKMILSTRSHTNFDCLKFAQAHGGGGHTKAAGFNQVLDLKTAANPYAFVEALVSSYEQPQGV